MNGVFYVFLFVFALVSLIGGVNWLMVGINDWDGNDDVPDLLQHQLGLPNEVSNIIYFVVFGCTLALFLMVSSLLFTHHSSKQTLFGRIR
jgi:uncharacterized membrane protein YuzA (DUF378 family)